MITPPDFVPSLCAEFPNDNPVMHQGVSWVCLTVRATARPVARPAGSAVRARRDDAEQTTMPPAVEPRWASNLERAVDDRRIACDAVAPVLEALLGARHEKPRAPEARPAVAPRPQTVAPRPRSSGRPLAVRSSSAPHPQQRFEWLRVAEPGWTEDVAEVIEAWLSAACEPTRPTIEWGDVIAEAIDDLFHSAPSSAVRASAASRAPRRARSMPVRKNRRSTILPRPKLETRLEIDPLDLDLQRLDDAATRRALRPVPLELELEAEMEQRGLTVPLEEHPAEDSAPATKEAHPLSEADAASHQDAFEAFVAALVEVAMNAGATRAAAVLPGVLNRARIDEAALDPCMAEGLVAAGIAGRRGGGFEITESFSATAGAWRDVLRGTSEDFSRCGTSTLDGWAVALLLALRVGEDERSVRRELRCRGVAAFGMLLAA